MKELIRKLVLQNAVKYNGKANPGAVIGHLLGKDPSLKDRMKELSKDINEIIKEVNKLPLEKQAEELKKTAPELLEEKKEAKERTLPKLNNAKGKVIMRFEPSPSGPLHVGHAYVLGLNSEYCREYNGELYLRISDTNPDNIYEPAYELIKEDAQWITKNNVKQFLIQSERLDIYYKYMEKLLSMEKAYVCECDSEAYKKLSLQQQACPCRELPKEEQLKRWKKMFSGYKEGDAVVRVKTDLQHKNPAMRDFPVFRINDSNHPRQKNKYRVWPLMNMAVAVDDIEMGITHIIRAKDHHDNAIRQKYIFDYLKKPFPETIFVGRINFEGMPVSCSKTRPLIEDGTYSGWDDIRLPFLQALKRRGYTPDAFIKYAIDVGISLSDKKVTREEFFKTINSFNKDAIDSAALRYFFVWNPKEITIENAPEQVLELDLHPDNKKGGRKFRVNGKFYITGDDFDSLKEGRLYRLMDCLNFTKNGSKLVFHSLAYRGYKEKGEKIMHWLPKAKANDVEVLMEDNKVIKGLGEEGMKSVKEGQVVQLERYGFARCDKKEKNKLIFWFTHK